MASLAVPTKRVSTTLRANPVPSARIGLGATAGRGSEFNKLAEELNSHPAERLRSCRASSDSTGPDLSGKPTYQELTQFANRLLPLSQWSRQLARIACTVGRWLRRGLPTD